MNRLSALTTTLFLTGASLFAADPQLLNLAPPDAQMFAGINVEQAKTSQFGQFLLANIPVGEDFETFISTTGFDPRNDLREVLIVTTGAPGVGHKSGMSGLVFAKGNFNIPRITTAAKADAHATLSTYAGAQMITFGAADSGQALALIDASTGIVGGLRDVKAALDRQSAPGAIAAAVLTRINQLSTTEDIWSVTTAKFSNLPIPGVGNGAGGSAVLASIQQASAGVKFGSQVQLDVQAVTASAQDASSLGDVVKLVAQMVQMHSGSGAETGGQVKDLLQSLNVSTEDNVVKISLALPEDQIEKLFRMAESHTMDEGKI